MADHLKAGPSTTYQDHLLYNLTSDSHQLVNLSGRYETQAVEKRLRERLIERMAEAGEATPSITPRPFNLYS